MVLPWLSWFVSVLLLFVSTMYLISAYKINSLKEHEVKFRKLESDHQEFIMNMSEHFKKICEEKKGK